MRAPKPLPRAYPQVLATIGDHLLKRRLDLGLLQREVAERLGADTCSVTNWELNRTSPALKFIPALVRFLGYLPFPAGDTLAEQLVAYRTARGLSQGATARLLGVDPATLSRWERGLRVPTGRYARRLQTAIQPDSRFPTPGPPDLRLSGVP